LNICIHIYPISSKSLKKYDYISILRKRVFAYVVKGLEIILGYSQWTLNPLTSDPIRDRRGEEVQ
jgi:hypothetical protein